MSKLDDNVLYKTAIWYAREKNWPVIALHTPQKNSFCSCMNGARCTTVGKHPRYHKKLLAHGAKSATTDQDIIKKWWTMWPNANIGIATGKKSFDVLDVDVKDDGLGKLSDLEDTYEKLPDTIEQITGSGGRQVLFKHTGKISNEVRFMSGLDTRSNGGLIVVPPSLHASGNKYEWEVSSTPRICDLADMPTWLIELINAAKVGGNGNSQKPTVDLADVFNGVPEGQRDKAIYGYACRLRSLGTTYEEAKTIILTIASRCNPPFKEHDAIRKLDSAWKHPEGKSLEYKNNGSNINTNKSNIYKIARDVPDVEYFKSPESQDKLMTTKDDGRRQNDDNVTTERRQLEIDSDFNDLLIASGLTSTDVTNVTEIINKTSEKEFDNSYLENLVVKVSSACRQSAVMRRQVSSTTPLAEEIRNWIYCHEGEFSIADVYRELNITSREIKKNASKVLERLTKEEKILEKVGNRRGFFRLIDDTVGELQFWLGSGKPVDLMWPLGIEKLAEIYPGNIILLAGESNAGKTGFLLNFTSRNLHKHNIHYFSSEMQNDELSSRLSNFGSVGFPLSEWKGARDNGKLKFYDRSFNFHDVLVPGHGNINIIDFLEIYEDFFRIGKYIYDIWRKLDGAIAIIAIQKNPNSDTGLGGARTLEKARLYISMGYRWLQFRKVKSPVKNPFPLNDHPDKYAVQFKYVNGCDYQITRDWWKPEQGDELSPKEVRY